MQTKEETVPASSLTMAQRQEVVAQLEVVLASSLFRQSKRYPAFLRYVVETTLEGDEEQLKERTIGMVVFGRQPNYDTSLDPTVRLTAAEVRKRLAQYYQQPEHAGEVHIDLHVGSYVPTFAWAAASVPMEVTRAPLAEVAVTRPMVTSDVDMLVPQRARTPRRMLGVAGLMAVLLLVEALLLTRSTSLSANGGKLWAPLLSDPNAVALVLPDLSKTELLPQAQETDATTVLSHIRENQIVDFNDSVALAKLSGLLGKWGKPYNVLLSSEATFADLQKGPTILIGAVDNPWTMRFLEPLPYSVGRRGASMTFAITGKKAGTDGDWSVDLAQPFGKLQQDYGVVVRETDTMTGKPVLIVAGIGQNATAAGIRLVAEPGLESSMMAAAPKGWSGRNVEVVFRTQVIDDKFGPPVVVAREYW